MSARPRALSSAVTATAGERSTLNHVDRVEPGVASSTRSQRAPAASKTSGSEYAVYCAGMWTPQRSVMRSVEEDCQAAAPSGAGSASSARRWPPSLSGRASTSAAHSGESAAGESSSDIATGCCAAFVTK